MKQSEKLTKYEKARIIGARSLQIAMGAPLLMDLDKTKFEKINYSTIEIAKMEFEDRILPINIKRPLPKKVAEKDEWWYQWEFRSGYFEYGDKYLFLGLWKDVNLDYMRLCTS